MLLGVRKRVLKCFEHWSRVIAEHVAKGQPGVTIQAAGGG